MSEDLQRKCEQHIDMLLKEAKTPMAFDQLDEIIDKLQGLYKEKVSLARRKEQVRILRDIYHHHYRNQADGFYR